MAGWRFQVRANGWGTKYRMLNEWGNEVAGAERVGRKYWTVAADGRTYEFRRASIRSREQELLSGGVRVGSVRRTSMWTGTIAADLPGCRCPCRSSCWSS